ncbi:MAG: zinc ribbon domain-containing protein [Armatimonadota bacterium]
MKCAKCGLDLPPNVKQCPKCGNVNEFTDVEKPRKTRPVAWIIAVLAVVAIAAIAVAAIVSSRAKPTITQAPRGNLPPGNIVTAPPAQPQPGNVVTAPAPVPPPGAVSPPGATKPKPPKEVVDYLEFVKKVEEHRQMLLRDTGVALGLAAGGSQATTLLKMIEMASDPDSKENLDPLKDAKTELIRQYKNWLSTLEYFDKKPAPDQCREFSGAYRDVLYKETMAIGTVAAGLQKVNIMDPKDMSRLLGELQKMKRDPSIQRGIDAAVDKADARLTELVSKYDMEKPFSVLREEQTGGSIMGF